MEGTDKIFFDSKKVKHKTLFIGTIIFVCIFGLIAFSIKAGYFSSLLNNLYSDSRDIGKEGLIHFSATTNEPGYFSSIFILDVASQEIFGLEATKTNAITNTEHVSPDGLSIVYSESILEIKNNQNYIPSMSQLVVFDSRYNTTDAITNSNTYKTTPEWSPSGTSIAFASRKLTKEVPVTDSESWDIIITDLSGSETFLTNGFQPQWFPDGIHLLVLKNNGVYIINKDTKYERELSGIEKIPMSPNMNIDLSRDGSRVVLSLSDSGRVFIINILSLESYKGEIEREIPGQAFWPVFSEDGNKVALYEVNFSSLDTNPRPRITVYNLETAERKTVYDLSAFDPESVAITDWRY